MKHIVYVTVATLAASLALATEAAARHSTSAAQDRITLLVTAKRQYVQTNRRVAWHWQDKARLHRLPTIHREMRTRSLPFLGYLVRWWHDRAYEAMRSYHERQVRARAPSQTPTYAVDSCLSQLISRESGWDVHAYNPSGAYGLPQALPGSKMASAGADWRDNPATQIRWMIGYVNGRYGGSCAALSFQISNGYY